jgi:pimeloyl-ACP methyl ester carboxylesterase
VLPDLPGRGASDAAPEASFTLDDEVRRLRLLIAAIPEARTGGLFVAGHSQGAAIALALAGREPRVRGLLLSSPVTPWTPRPRILDSLRSDLMRRGVAGMFSPLRGPLASVIIRRAAGPGFRAPRELVEAYAAPYADRRRARTLMALLRDWRPAELETRLPEAAPPTRVVTGALDPRIEAGLARRLAERLGATYLIVEDGGHVLPEQHPDLMAGELERLLDDARDDEQN